MIRNLKALGLALFAFLAFGVMVSSSAIAQEEEGEIYATAGEYPVHITGEDVLPTANQPTAAFTGNGNVLECKKSKYTINLTAASKRVTVVPTYEECSTSTGAPVTVTMNGCDYEFHHATTEAGNTDAWTVTSDLKCPEGKVVELHEYASAAKHTEGVSNCTITLAAANNQNLSGGTLTEETNASDSLRMEGTLHPLAQTHGACSFGLTVNLESELHLSATVTGNKPVGIKD